MCLQPAQRLSVSGMLEMVLLNNEKKSHQIIAGNYHSEVFVLGDIVIMVYYVSENKILGI